MVVLVGFRAGWCLFQDGGVVVLPPDGLPIGDFFGVEGSDADNDLDGGVVGGHG